MALFKRRPKAVAVAEPVEQRATYRVPTFTGGSLMTPAGVIVDAQSALRNAAVWACQRVIVATISGFPVDVIRVMGGRRSPVDVQPEIVANPSGLPSVRRRAWVAQAVRSAVQCGNIYGNASGFDGAGRPSQIDILDFSCVSWRKVDGRVAAFVDGKPREIWPLGDLWHVPVAQFMLPGQPFAMSPTDYASTAIGTGIAAEEFGSRFFGDGAHPTAVATVDDPDLTAEQAEAVKARLMSIIRGSREPLVLGSAWELKQWQVSPEDSQFLELMQFEVLQACRVWGVPPSMAFAAVTGQNVTYANVSDSDLQFLKYGVTPWMIDLEDAWSELIVRPQVVKFNVSGLLRMDAMQRATLHKLRLDSKTTTVNEVREHEDEEPFGAEFDEPGIPGVEPSPVEPAVQGVS
jgi:HK97 family phage portal protein